MLTFDDYLALIEEAATRLATSASDAGLQAPVPTCPRWTVADLVAHQAMVHRWAAGQLRLDTAPVPSKRQILSDVALDDLLPWFRRGAADLLSTLRDVAEDVPAMVFLADAPAPRLFWARRQAHETTIHSVDAVAAAKGEVPASSDVGVAAEAAVDGIDELLTGFFPRGRARMEFDGPVRIAVVPDDAASHRWTMTVADGKLTTSRAVESDADATLTGTAAQLYLGLWNRGDEVAEFGGAGVLDQWRKVQRVRWS